MHDLIYSKCKKNSCSNSQALQINTKLIKNNYEVQTAMQLTYPKPKWVLHNNYILNVSKLQLRRVVNKWLNKQVSMATKMPLILGSNQEDNPPAGRTTINFWINMRKPLFHKF